MLECAFVLVLYSGTASFNIMVDDDRVEEIMARICQPSWYEWFVVRKHLSLYHACIITAGVAAVLAGLLIWQMDRIQVHVSISVCTEA